MTQGDQSCLAITHCPSSDPGPPLCFSSDSRQPCCPGNHPGRLRCPSSDPGGVLCPSSDPGDCAAPAVTQGECSATAKTQGDCCPDIDPRCRRIPLCNGRTIMLSMLRPLQRCLPSGCTQSAHGRAPCQRVRRRRQRQLRIDVSGHACRSASCSRKQTTSERHALLVSALMWLVRRLMCVIYLYLGLITASTTSTCMTHDEPTT